MITDFITKGKKRLHSIQLTADVTKKSNTRLVPTNRENTVKIVREILRDIIYSEYPLKISPIFAHLKSKKPKKVKNPKKIAPIKNLGKTKKIGFKCGICTKEYPSARTLNTHCSKTHPKQNLLCTIAKCTFKSKLEKDLQDHTKERHERVKCKTCAIITIGYAQKLHHENSVHGKESHAPAKVWVQPKKTYINRRVKKIQKEVNKLNKDGNIYNNLLNIPEIPDLDKIKKHFTKTVTAQQCRDALDRLDKWVAKEKASKTAAKIRENILLKAERRRQKHDRELNRYDLDHY